MLEKVLTMKSKSESREVLLIGGEADGKRVSCDPNVFEIRVYMMDTDIFNEDRCDLYYANNCKQLVYNKYNISSNKIIGIHDKMTFLEGVAQIIKKYPKKRKPSSRIKSNKNLDVFKFPYIIDPI